jgi:acyl-CoA thioesterase
MFRTDAKNFNELVGLVLTRRDDGGCSSEIVLEPRHLSLAGRVHGGLLATVLDTTLGGAVFGRIPEGKGCATLSLNISYFRPVVEGKLVCTARVENLSRQTAYASAEIVDGEGRLIAAATATFFVTPTVQTKKTEVRSQKSGVRMKTKSTEYQFLPRKRMRPVKTRPWPP